MLDDASRLMPASIKITIGAEEVAMLISVAGPAHQADPLWIETLQIRGSGGHTLDPDDPRFLSGTLFWCERALEAMAVCQYERACGYNATMLWDVYGDDTALDRDVVLSSRPFAQHARTQPAVDDDEIDELPPGLRPLYDVAGDLAAVVADLPACEYLQTYLPPLYNFGDCTGYHGMHPVAAVVAYLCEAIEHQPALSADLAQRYQDELERHLQFSVQALRDDARAHDPYRAASPRAATDTGLAAWWAAGHADADGWPDS
jgi:hypothetical protein